MKRPFVVYADFECSLIKSDEPGILQKHEPNSAAFYFVNTVEPTKNKLWSYVGKDCVSNLIIALNELAKECIEAMMENKIWISQKKSKINLNLLKLLSL